MWIKELETPILADLLCPRQRTSGNSPTIQMRQPSTRRSGNGHGVRIAGRTERSAEDDRASDAAGAPASRRPIRFNPGCARATGKRARASHIQGIRALMSRHAGSGCVML
jgi:hypothetical protein